MSKVKTISAIAPLLIGIGFAIHSCWPARLHIELELEHIEPSGMMDNFGEECWLMDVRVINRSRKSMFLNSQKQCVLARFGNNWLRVADPVRFWGLRANSTNTFVLVVPKRAEVCRIEFEYQWQPFSLHSYQWISRGVQDWSIKTLPPVISKQLWPSVTGPDTNKWRTDSVELMIPRLIVP